MRGDAAQYAHTGGTFLPTGDNENQSGGDGGGGGESPSPPLPGAPDIPSGGTATGGYLNEDDLTSLLASGAPSRAEFSGNFDDRSPFSSGGSTLLPDARAALRAEEAALAANSDRLWDDADADEDSSSSVIPEAPPRPAVSENPSQDHLDFSLFKRPSAESYVSKKRQQRNQQRRKPAPETTGGTYQQGVRGGDRSTTPAEAAAQQRARMGLGQSVPVAVARAGLSNSSPGSSGYLSDASNDSGSEPEESGHEPQSSRMPAVAASGYLSDASGDEGNDTQPNAGPLEAVSSSGYLSDASQEETELSPAPSESPAEFLPMREDSGTPSPQSASAAITLPPPAAPKKKMLYDPRFDYNERFQAAWHAIINTRAGGFTPAGSNQALHRQLNEALSGAGQDFMYVARMHARVIASELHLPEELKTIKPANMGGVAGGTKFIASGILFKVRQLHRFVFEILLTRFRYLPT
jgi:hypothetical protein